MEHFYKNIKGWSRNDMQGVLIDWIFENYDMTNHLKIVEVGVYLGRLTAMWNVELINNDCNYTYFGIDHFEGSAEHKESSELPNYNKALENLKPIFLNNDNLNIIKNTSKKSSNLFDDNSLDIVYIDASHDYESVISDIELWYPKVKKGGIICGDDYHKNWPGVIKAVNQKFDNVTIIGNTQWVMKKQ